MSDMNQLLERGRNLLREKPELTESEFRDLMLEKLRANDQGLQEDKSNMSSGPVDPLNGIFSVLALPWAMFRWLGFRSRLARHRTEIDEVVRNLRQEGKFAERPS